MTPATKVLEREREHLMAVSYLSRYLMEAVSRRSQDSCKPCFEVDHIQNYDKDTTVRKSDSKDDDERERERDEVGNLKTNIREKCSATPNTARKQAILRHEVRDS